MRVFCSGYASRRMNGFYLGYSPPPRYAYTWRAGFLQLVEGWCLVHLVGKMFNFDPHVCSFYFAWLSQFMWCHCPENVLSVWNELPQFLGVKWMSIPNTDCYKTQLTCVLPIIWKFWLSVTVSRLALWVFMLVVDQYYFSCNIWCYDCTHFDIFLHWWFAEIPWLTCLYYLIDFSWKLSRELVLKCFPIAWVSWFWGAPHK